MMTKICSQRLDHHLLIFAPNVLTTFLRQKSNKQCSDEASSLPTIHDIRKLRLNFKNWFSFTRQNTQVDDLPLLLNEFDRNMCRLNKSAADQLKQDEGWIANLDLKEFRREIQELGERLEKEQGDADVKHLNKIVGWSNCCAAIGLLTMGFSVNIVSIIALSTWTFSRWVSLSTQSMQSSFLHSFLELK